jgi:hypothetical protein
VRLRAFGTYSMRVADPAKFMTEIVGTDGEFTADEISFQIRNIIVQEVSRVWPVGHPGAGHGGQHRRPGQAGDDRHRAADRGIRAGPARVLHREHLASRRGRKGAGQAHLVGIAGDLTKYMQFNAAEAIGMGMAGQIGPWGAAPAPAAPPPPPAATEPLWHIAENGASTGPFAQSALQGMAAAGTLTPASLVWTAGQDSWQPAGQTKLAGLFAQVPPPLPGT